MPRSYRHIKEYENEILKLKAQGKTLREIGTMYGFTYIEVHHAERIDGVKTQKLVIHYNCAGVIDVPEDTQIDTPEVQVQTRKGVSVNYLPTTT